MSVTVTEEGDSDVDVVGCGFVRCNLALAGATSKEHWLLLALGLAGDPGSHASSTRRWSFVMEGVEARIPGRRSCCRPPIQAMLLKDAPNFTKRRVSQRDTPAGKQ